MENPSADISKEVFANKYIYSNREILQIQNNDYCFVKPLHIVKIWRRKTRFSKNPRSKSSSPCRIIRVPFQPAAFQKAEIRAKLILSESKKTDPVNPKILSTLNKLTPTNKIKLQSQLFEIAIQNNTNLQTLAEKIFQKACFEKKYTGMWAELCFFLSSQYKAYQDRLSLGESPSSKKNKFKTALLGMSQLLFEDFKKTSESPVMLKKKIMGNMSFIGELFKINIIPPKVIVECLFELLRIDLNEKVDEDKIEGASVLINSCGAKSERLGEALGEIIRIIENIIGFSQVSPRIKFLLLVCFI